MRVGVTRNVKFMWVVVSRGITVRSRQKCCNAIAAPKLMTRQNNTFPRLSVTAIEYADLFDDALNIIARDGAGMIEVELRLQKALHALAQIGDEKFRERATIQSRLSLERALDKMSASQDLKRVSECASWSG